MTALPLPDRSAALLDAAAVGKTFGGRLCALEGFSLRVGAGERVALVGPSGCGKSTVLRMAAGLVRPDRGRFAVASGQRPAMVFQDPTLMPWARVAANVRVVLDLDGVARAASVKPVAEALALVGLSEFAHAFPRELSGGMRMRVSLARALVTQPTLLLMDEPFGALDDLTRQRLDDEVLALAGARGLSLLLVTHNLAEAVYLADRVVVMSARPGRVVTQVAVQPARRDAAWRLSAPFAQCVEAVAAGLRLGCHE